MLSLHHIIPHLTNFTYDCNRLLLKNSILFSRHLDIPVTHCERVDLSISNTGIQVQTRANGNDVICWSMWVTLHKVTIYFRDQQMSTNFSIKKNTKQQHCIILCINVLMYELLTFLLYWNAFLFVLFLSVFLYFFFHFVMQDYCSSLFYVIQSTIAIKPVIITELMEILISNLWTF